VEGEGHAQFGLSEWAMPLVVEQLGAREHLPTYGSKDGNLTPKRMRMFQGLRLTSHSTLQRGEASGSFPNPR
jgi:hypothetical protein